MTEPSYEELLAAHRVEKESVRVVEGALAAFNRGDSAGFLENFADDLQFRMNGTHRFSRPCRSKAEFVALVAEVAAGLSEMITLEVDRLLPAGEWVVCETRGRARTARGEPYENTYCMLWHVKNGKIVEFREHNDSAKVERFFPG